MSSQRIDVSNKFLDKSYDRFSNDTHLYASVEEMEDIYRELGIYGGMKYGNDETRYDE